MKYLDDLVEQKIEAIRDARRPPFELALEVIRAAFDEMRINVTQVHDGPEIWMWEDEMMLASGLPKFYILSRSTQDGMDGYPLLTVRQAYSVKLDTWISMSSLIVGPDEVGISHAIALTIANHAGAFAGVRYASAASAAHRGDPQAAILAVRHLMEAEPPDFNVDDDMADLLEKTEPDHGSMN